VQEIRNLTFDLRGNVTEQRIATYSGSLDDPTSVLYDVKVIVNEDLNSLGYAKKTTIYKYASGSVLDDPLLDQGTHDGVINYSNFMDVTLIETKTFDLRGNAIDQTVKKYYKEDMSELAQEQVITNLP